MSASAIRQPPPYLTDAEILDICQPLTMPAAQRRHLARLGLLVKEKPNGRPLVARAEFERVMCHQAPAQNDPVRGPNVVALRQHMEAMKNGKKQKG